MPITVKRASDGKTHKFNEISPKSSVRSLKSEIKEHLAPNYEHGCRLKTPDNKVMKSRHKLQHYNIADNATVLMDDSKNWSSSSDTSESLTD